jgi:DnaK suppressor protein
MTKAELAGYRRALLALRARLSGDVASLEDEALQPGEEASNLSHVPLHPADLGTDAHGRDVALGLLENEQRALGEVTAALGRVERGTFGPCEGCGEAIPEGRLHALPYARYCVGCARRWQP